MTTDMPRTGTARYTAQGYGTYANHSGAIDVDFAAASLSGNLVRTSIARITFTAPINGSTFYGPATSTSLLLGSPGSTSGIVSGSFYGPGAAEIGGVLEIGAGGGSFVGAR